MRPRKIIVPPLAYKAIVEKYPHLASQFEPYQHIPDLPHTKKADRLST